MDNTGKNEILTVVNEILISMVGLNTKMDSMQKEVAKIPEMQKEIAKISEIQKEVAKIPEMQTQIKELQKDTKSISRSVAVIEHEHGDKLKALFDAFTANTEKMETEEKRINFCERKIENHDTDIYYLKTKVQGL